MSAARVSLIIGERTHEFVMDCALTVLEGAEAAGIDWPSQCQAGLCGTCRARLVSGSVAMLENLVLDDDELAAGWVLPCQAVPETAEVILALEDP